MTASVCVIVLNSPIVAHLLCVLTDTVYRPIEFPKKKCKNLELLGMASLAVKNQVGTVIRNVKVYTFILYYVNMKPLEIWEQL